MGDGEQLDELSLGCWHGPYGDFRAGPLQVGGGPLLDGGLSELRGAACGSEVAFHWGLDVDSCGRPETGTAQLRPPGAENGNNVRPIAKWSTAASDRCCSVGCNVTYLAGGHSVE